MKPQPQQKLVPGGSFFDRLRSAYYTADSGNRAALEHGFPTLRAILYAHTWTNDNADSPAVCVKCGCEATTPWTPKECAYA